MTRPWKAETLRRIHGEPNMANVGYVRLSAEIASIREPCAKRDCHLAGLNLRVMLKNVVGRHGAVKPKPSVLPKSMTPGD